MEPWDTPLRERRGRTGDIAKPLFGAPVVSPICHIPCHRATIAQGFSINLRKPGDRTRANAAMAVSIYGAPFGAASARTAATNACAADGRASACAWRIERQLAHESCPHRRAARRRAAPQRDRPRRGWRGGSPRRSRAGSVAASACGAVRARPTPGRRWARSARPPACPRRSRDRAHPRARHRPPSTPRARRADAPGATTATSGSRKRASTSTSTVPVR